MKNLKAMKRRRTAFVLFMSFMVKFSSKAGFAHGLICACLLLLCGCSSIKPPAGVKPVERTLTVTGYCRCGECTGWRRTWYGRPVYSSGPNKGKRKEVGVTASGTKAKVGTIAADTTRYPFGTIMHIPGYGYGRVEDRGGAIKGEHIDLFFRSHSAAEQWGKQKLKVKVWFVAAE